MRCTPISFMMVVVFHHAVGSAEVSRCERLFNDSQRLATCGTVSSLYSDLSDEELRERVSKSVFGVSAEKADAELARREVRSKQRQAEDEASLKETDQCYRLFDDPLDRETCRTLRMLTIRTRTDDEMRRDVREHLAGKKMDLEKERKAATDAESKRRDYDAWLLRTAREEEKRRVEQAKRERQAVQEKERQRVEQVERERQAVREKERQRAEQAQREKQATIAREKQQKAAREALDKTLANGVVGFSFLFWEKGGFGNILITHFIVQNNTSSALKDFEIVCDARANSDTLLGTPRAILYERLNPGARQSYSLNMGLVHSQTARVSCRLNKWIVERTLGDRPLRMKDN